ncbi:MAG: hypothetical protein R3234_13455, partial [Thermoanaerobaculia bacterium]|nr:hypothetical protein [Thermoanaerobaculia bacterium]
MPPSRSQVARLILGGSRTDAEARLLEASWRERGRRARLFIAFLFRKIGDDAVTLKAAALSFVTILSLVPLLAAFTNVGTRVLVRYQRRVLEIL